MSEWKRGLPPGKLYDGMEFDFEVQLTIGGSKWHRRRSAQEAAELRRINREHHPDLDAPPPEYGPDWEARRRREGQVDRSDEIERELTGAKIYPSSLPCSEKAQKVVDALLAPTLRPCCSPYCECEPGKCTAPGFYDARGTPPANVRHCRRCNKDLVDDRGGCEGAQHGNVGCFLNNPDMA